MNSVYRFLRSAVLAVSILAIFGCPSSPGAGCGAVPPPALVQPDGHVCTCTCQYESGESVEFNVSACFPSGGLALDQRNADCMGRVQTTVSRLNEHCNYPPCECQAKGSGRAGTIYSGGVCDRHTAGINVNSDCSNFDPQNGMTQATNVMGDPPIWTPYSPLSATIFGRRTSCAVSGNTRIEVEDEDPADSQTTGMVNFVGEPCPGQTCAARMEYNLDFGSVSFGNIIHEESFSELAAIGHSSAGNDVVLSSNGDGTFGVGAIGNAGRGRRNGGDLYGLETTNPEAVSVNVGWAANTCRFNGSVTGSGDPDIGRCENAGPSAGQICDDDSDCTDDPECSDEDCNCQTVDQVQVGFALNLNGTIVNQPPTANAGADQTIECATAAATDVVLNGSGSSDPDSNIAIYRWFANNRVGSTVGTTSVVNTTQALGARNYVLRVIDAMGQAHDNTTEVDVVDTTPPVVSCAVTTTELGVMQITHDLVNVGLAATAADQCSGALPVNVSVFSDEDDEEIGDGNQSPDARNIAINSLRLRSERRGTGDGRVYLIVSDATDPSGNRGFACCTVAVPLSNKSATRTSVRNQAAAAAQYCQLNAGTPPPGYFVVGDGPIIGGKQ